MAEDLVARRCTACWQGQIVKFNSFFILPALHEAVQTDAAGASDQQGVQRSRQQQPGRQTGDVSIGQA